MHRTIYGCLAFCAALLCGSTSAHADDWYVDAQNGLDTNDGQSESTAWRTLTHAITAIPSHPVADHTIHVAPGLHDAALGETYPLRPRPGMRIVGTQGSAATILDGGGLAVLRYAGTEQIQFDATSGAEGLTLRNGLDGVQVSVDGGETRPAFRELAIEGMSLAGIWVYADEGFPSSIATPTGEDLRIEGCDRGVELGSVDQAVIPPRPGIQLTRTLIRGSASSGLQMLGGDDCNVHVSLDRCQVVENGADGVYCSALTLGAGSAALDARASLFAGNGGCGVFERGMTWFHFEDCTVAHNAFAGVRGVEDHEVSFRNCVVAGNADDVDVMGALDASWSNAANGDLSGFPHCIAVDPKFVDPSGGDYRLRFGSRCIEAGDPASAGALDLLGQARPYDGNLDTLTAVDMGAFEHAPLAIRGTPGLGQTMTYELWGAPGATARLLFAPVPLVDPAPTPYGTLRLDRRQVVVVMTLSIPTAPRLFQRRLPADPSLVGTTFAFQTLTSSAAAPHAWALSNPVSFVIEP